MLLHLSDAPGVSQAIEQALSRANLPVVTHLFNQGGRFFLAEDRGMPAGFVRLASGSREMQIVLMVERGRWGRGLGKAMLREALKQAFFEMRTPRVVAVIHRDNHRSLRLFARAGFALEWESGVWTRHALTLQGYLQNIREGKSMASPIHITQTD
ncbi:MAG TPA: GNAT family N-acetyltransferase, partial [Clostridia bacterium]|nr:GNAT family N-acetyltransferase [Clostridia bacterium]